MLQAGLTRVYQSLRIAEGHSGNLFMLPYELSRIVMFYCGQLPFRLTLESEKVIKIKESIFHKIYSGITSLVGLSFIVKETVMFAQFDLYSKPEIIFKILSQVGRATFHIWWIYAFNTKQVELQKLLDEISKHTIYSKWHKIKCFAFPGIGLVLNIMLVYFFGANLITPFLNLNNSSFLHNMFQIGAAFGFFFAFNMQVSVTTLALVLAFSAYETGTVHVNLAKGVIAEGHTVSKLHGMFTKMTLNLKNYYVILNRFGRGFFLALFFKIVPWMAYHLVENLPGMKPLYSGRLVYNWTFIIFYGTILIVCAEARKQVEVFRRTIFHALCKNDPLSPANLECMRSIANALKDSGLKGVYFFMLSYQFLGSTIGLVVTYAFLYLQFNSK